MRKNCFMSECQEIPTAYCKCETPSVYFCSSHYQLHNQSGLRVHNTVLFLKTIPVKSFQPFSAKVSEFLVKLQETKSKLCEMASSVISKIQSETNSQLKILESLEEDLDFFISWTMKSQTGESVKVDTEYQESVEQILLGNHLNVNEIIAKSLKSLKVLLKRKNLQKVSHLTLLDKKELCLDCKTGYYIKCGFHLFCEICKICYCKKCLESTNYLIEDTKKDRLQIEQTPVISFTDQSIQTSLYRAYNSSMNQFLMISKNVSKNVKQLQYNYSILKFLSKKLPSFLVIYGNNLRNNEMMIVSELAIQPLRTAVGEDIQCSQVIKIARELVEGFTFMSLYRIFHRNIGLKSILLTETMTPKIIDFSLAVLHSTDCNSDKISLETLAQAKDDFLAPERKEFILKVKNNLKAEPYNIEKSDVFSLGCVFFMLFTRFQYDMFLEKFDYADWVKQYKNKIERKEIRKVIKKMLDPNPKRRPFFKQVFEEFMMINSNAY